MSSRPIGAARLMGKPLAALIQAIAKSNALYYTTHRYPAHYRAALAEHEKFILYE
jgi:hypothetical protein